MDNKYNRLYYLWIKHLIGDLMGPLFGNKDAENGDDNFERLSSDAENVKYIDVGDLKLTTYLQEGFKSELKIRVT